MFSFRFKNTSTAIAIYIIQALFVVAAIAAYVYTENVYIRYVSILALLVVVVFTKTILKRYRVNPLVLLSAGAIITLLTSGSVVFAVVLIMYGVFLKIMNKETRLDVNAEMILVKYALYERVYKWTDMSNVILKDGLLTLDFRSNRIFQSEVAEYENPVDEENFNQFCAKQIQHCREMYPALYN